MKSKLCQHCLPSKRRTHINLYIDYYLEKFPKLNLSSQKLDNLVLKLLSFLNIVRFESNIDKTKFYNRSLIFWIEGKKRGLKLDALKVLGKFTQEFRLELNGKKYYYEGTPLNIFPSPDFLDNKIKIKKLLYKNNVPVPEGELFWSFKRAEKFAKKIGFPVVVKPNNGSLSHHISVPVDSLKNLKKAIKIAKIYQPEFIVEKFISGSLYRVTVIGQKFIFVSLKEKANVIGDGHSKIFELIKIKNNNKLRGETEQMNTTLHKIPVDQKTLENLKSQKLSLSSVLLKNQKVYLQNKYILSTGCDIYNLTDKIHPRNKEIFLKISKLLQTQLLGIDFISLDIRKPAFIGECGVLEVNSLPYLDMHQYPTSGRPYDVAKVGWDFVLKKLKSSV